MSPAAAALAGAWSCTEFSQRTHFVIDKTAVTNGFAKTRKSSPSKQQHAEETRGSFS